MRFARMRQYRRNFLRLYPDGPERMAAQQAARPSLKLAGRTLFLVFTVGALLGYLLAWKVVGR